MKLCPHCQREVQDEAIKCRWCQKYFSNAELRAAQGTNRPKKKSGCLLFLSGIMLIAFLLINYIGLPSSYDDLWGDGFKEWGDFLNPSEIINTLTPILPATEKPILSNPFDQLGSDWRTVAVCTGGIRGGGIKKILISRRAKDEYLVLDFYTDDPDKNPSNEYMDQRIRSMEQRIRSAGEDGIGAWYGIQTYMRDPLNNYSVCTVDPIISSMEELLRQKYSYEISCVAKQYQNNLSLNYEFLSKLNYAAFNSVPDIGGPLFNYAAICLPQYKKTIDIGFNSFVSYEAVKLLGHGSE